MYRARSIFWLVTLNKFKKMFWEWRVRKLLKVVFSKSWSKQKIFNVVCSEISSDGRALNIHEIQNDTTLEENEHFL